MKFIQSGISTCNSSQFILASAAIAKYSALEGLPLLPYPLTCNLYLLITAN